MKFSLEGKSAVVTGGGSGIGKAIWLALAEHGTTVYILELKEASAKETADIIEANGGRAMIYGYNVADGRKVKKAFEAITAMGPIDI